MVHIIVVLGISRGIKNGKVIPGYHLEFRLKHVLKVWRLTAGEKIVICSGGETNRGPEGKKVFESSVMANWLIQHGIPSYRVFQENQSRNTIENCLYSYSLITKFIKRGGYIQDDYQPQNVEWEKLGETNFHQTNTGSVYINLVTNDWHMPRASSIFSFFIYRPMKYNHLTKFYLSFCSSTDRTEDYDQCVVNEKLIFQNLHSYLLNTK